MEFQKNHNLTDGALVRIGQSIGKDVEIQGKQAQVEDAKVVRDGELLEKVGMIGEKIADLYQRADLDSPLFNILDKLYVEANRAVVAMENSLSHHQGAQAQRRQED